MNTRDAWTLGLHEILCHFCFPFCVAHRGFFREAAWTHPSLKHADRLRTHEAQSTTKVRYFCIFSSWKLRYLRLIRFPFCPFSFSTSARNCARCWQRFLLAFRSIASAVSRNEPARSLKLPIRFDYVRSSCFFVSASVSRVAYQRAEISESVVDRFHEVFPQNHFDFIVFFSDLLNSKPQRAPVSTPICTDSLQGISQSVQQQQQQQTQQQQQQQPQQQPNQHQESLCSEMARELCRALRCHASSRRRRACEKCSTHVLGYTPDNPTATPLNGMRSQVRCFYKDDKLYMKIPREGLTSIDTLIILQTKLFLNPHHDLF